MLSLGKQTRLVPVLAPFNPIDAAIATVTRMHRIPFTRRKRMDQLALALIR
jgi:hypothetical protein